MDFDDYQKQAAKYDLGKVTPGFSNVSFMEKVLGLAGETGEVVDKIKSLEKRKVDMDSDEAKQEVNTLLRNIATDTEDIGSSHDKILKHINVSSFGDWIDSTDD